MTGHLEGKEVKKRYGRQIDLEGFHSRALAGFVWMFCCSVPNLQGPQVEARRSNGWRRRQPGYPVENQPLTQNAQTMQARPQRIDTRQFLLVTYVEHSVSSARPLGAGGG